MRWYLAALAFFLFALDAFFIYSDTSGGLRVISLFLLLVLLLLSALAFFVFSAIALSHSRSSPP